MFLSTTLHVLGTIIIRILLIIDKNSISRTRNDTDIDLVILYLVFRFHDSEEPVEQGFELNQRNLLVHKDDDVQTSVAEGIVDSRAVFGVSLIVAEDASPVGLVGIESFVVWVYRAVH